MDALETKLVELIDTAEGLAPAATDAVLAATQLTGVSYLLAGFVFLILAVIANKWIGKSIVAEAKAYDEGKGSKPDKSFHLFMYVVGNAMTSVPALLILMDIWNWVAIFAPETYLAKSLLSI